MSSVVDSDANGSCESRADLRLSQLLQRETSSISDLGRIPSSRAIHQGSQQLNRSGEHSGSLCLSVVRSSLLVSGLVEPRLHKARPVLAEVSVRELIIVLNHLANLYIQ